MFQPPSSAARRLPGSPVQAAVPDLRIFQEVVTQIRRLLANPPKMSQLCEVNRQVPPDAVSRGVFHTIESRNE